MHLINRLTPLPYESMVGLLERLRRANHYEEPYWYHGFLPKPIPHNINALRLATHYRILAELTGISPERLAACTIHRFVPAFYPEEELATLVHEYGDSNIPMWKWSDTGRWIHSSSVHKVCPLCYSTDQTFFAPWQLRLITSCQKHQVMLVDTCPSCQNSLCITISSGTCARCGKPVHSFPTTSISNHPASLQLTNLLWSAIECGSKPYSPASLSIDANNPLHNMATCTLFTFLWRGAQLLLSRDPNNPIFNDSTLLIPLVREGLYITLQQANVNLIHNMLTAMWQLLQYWPETWHMTLDRIAATEDDGYARFPRMLQTKFRGGEWDWLHQSWMAYMQVRTDTDIVYPWLRYYRIAQRLPDRQFPELLSQREAARRLGISEQNLKTHIASGDLRTTRPPAQNHKRPWRLIEAESVKQLGLARKTQLSLTEAANSYGVSKEQIVALVAAGLLQATSGPLVDGTSTWCFSTKAIMDSLTALLENVPIRTLPSGFTNEIWDLLRVQRTLSTIGIRLPHLLALVQEGTLPTYRAENTIGLHVLWWESLAVLTTLSQFVQAEQPVMLSANMVCERLECKPTTLKHLVSTRLLMPIQVQDPTKPKDKRRQVYDERDVISFQKRYITTDIAAKILRITPITVQNWARAGRLTALMGPSIDGSHIYRFDKTMLAEWRYQRLTFGEALKFLGVSKATLDRWVKQGKLIPLNDMDGKQRWFGREDVVRLQRFSTHL
ncbi:helix-turn-helix domain-containing protein [Chloroflexia bacterium SDU3-3]|nr:helix-turn-helix domain-containing protein [Chloroflexia bacterium SDU3-3]